MKALKQIIFAGLALAILAGIFIWSGVYNIAANEPHWGITTEILEVVRERSIEVRAEDLTPPDKISPELMASAASGYSEMCVQCHLAPGIEPTELHKGLYPQPPVFYKNLHGAHDPRETFWVIQNGIKLTGMPAWGEVHRDEEIWALVKFIEQLPDMSAEDFANITRAAEASGHGHSHANSNDKPAHGHSSNGADEHTSSAPAGHDATALPTHQAPPLDAAPHAEAAAHSHGH